MDAARIDGRGQATITGDRDANDILVDGGDITDAAAILEALTAVRRAGSLDERETRIFDIIGEDANTILTGLMLTGGKGLLKGGKGNDTLALGGLVRDYDNSVRECEPAT